MQKNPIITPEECKVINSGKETVTVTNGHYTLPNTVLKGYSGNYICISGVVGCTAYIGYNSLNGASATQKSGSDYTAMYQFSGSYTVVYTIIRV